MSFRALTVGVAALVWAVPAVAQQRGTMEFGAFGSAAKFDKELTLDKAYGGGGRIGMFLDPRWSIEFEDAEMRATRTNGLKDVNVGILSGRLVAVPIQSGAFSLLVGAGAGIGTETNFLHTYGVDALAGFKFAFSDKAALRVDGVWDWLANEFPQTTGQKWLSYRSVRVGLSMYRHPRPEIRTVTVVTPAPPPVVIRSDSVSADEIRRLRNVDAALRTLRDSLTANPPAACAPCRAVPEKAIPIRKDVKP
jgi:hypothetical protein